MDRLVPPYRGVSNHAGYIDTPPGLYPYAVDADGLPRARNFIPHSPGSKDRGTIGQRAGHSKLFSQQSGGPGGSPWQALIPASRSSVVEGYRTGTCTLMVSGNSVVSGAIAGNYMQLDSVPSSDGTGTLDVSDDGGGTANSVNADAVCPRQTINDSGQAYYLCYVSSNYTRPDGFLGARIRCFRDDTGATVWSYDIHTAGQDRFVNTMTCSDNFLFVCTNAVVLMIRCVAGTLVREESLNAWAQETIECGIYKTSAGVEWLFVGFNGTEVGSTTQTGLEITAGTIASQFRAGVMRFRIENEYVSVFGPYQAPSALTRDTFGWGQTINQVTGVEDNFGSPFDEGPHGYFRISERGLVTGHGCLVTALHVDPRNGNVIVGRTNQGYGPNAAYPPDGLTYPSSSCFAIRFDGRLLWESDTNSILEPGVGGYQNDIPTSGTDDPSISAIRCNARGEIVAAGRQNIADYSVFGLDADTGVLQWQANVESASGTIRQGAMAVDVGDGHFVMGGDRNDEWDGADPGDDRNLWKLHSQTGEVLWSFDWGANVSVLAVAEMPDGSLVVGTDRI